MAYELFQLGGIIFWVLTAIGALLLITEIESDKVGAAFVTIIGYFVVLALFSDTDLWAWVQNNVTFLLYSFGAYLGAAAVWSVAKWYLFLTKVRNVYSVERDQYAASHPGVDFSDPADVKKVRDNAVEKLAYTKYSTRNVPPRASEQKARITAWMTFWPFSVIGTVIGDLLLEVFKHIFDFLSGLYQRMSNKMFGGFAELK